MPPLPLPAARRSGFVLVLTSLLVSGCVGGGSSSSTPTVSPATAPLAITAIAPTNIPVGSGDMTLVVTGAGFTSSSVVSLNGTTEPTTYTSATELHAAVTAAQLKVGAVLSLAVANGATVVKADPQSVALSVDNPVPSLGSVAPTVILVGTPDTAIIVTGTSFVPGVSLSVNGTPRTTTYMSDTKLSAQLSAADFNIAGPLPLNVINPKPGGGTSGTSALSVANVAPSITTLSPASLAVGAGNTTVTLTGTGFLASTALQVNGASRGVTVLSATQMTFVLTAADLAMANTLAITATNPQPGGGTSTASFTVQNPSPAISAISPSTLLAGGDATTLVVTGTGFVKTSTVQVNGAVHNSTYVSDKEIDVPLTAAELASSGSFALAVLNGQPGGGTSAGASVPVNNPVPSIASLSPATISIGSAATTITINGTGFLPGTTLQVNGTAHAATYTNGKQLTVTFTAAELAKSATLALTASNAVPGGGMSAPISLTVGSAAPVIAVLSPSALPTGSAATTISVTGTGFLPTSTLQLNGYTRATATYVSSTQFTFPLTATDLSYYGTYAVTISNPAGLGGVSQSANFTVQARTPIISKVTPASLITNSGVNTINVTGTNLTPDSTVLWNGTALTTTYSQGYTYTGNTYAYAYALYAIVPEKLTASNGSASITVSTTTAPAISNVLSVAITDPPVPTITGLTPNNAPVNADIALTLTGTGFNKSSAIAYNGTALTTTFSSSTQLQATVPASMVASPGNGAVTVVTSAPGGGTSASAALTVYVPIVSNSMVFNPVTGLAYLSIPSSGSTVAGNSVVSFDPATGTLGTPIFVGSEPGVMAVSDDGTTLWVALNGTTAIRKVDLVHAVAGAQYSVSAVGYAYSTSPLAAILVLPGTTDSVAVSGGYAVGIYDAGVLRGSTVNANSVYALQADGTRQELYVGNSYNSLQIYTYSSAGLAAKATNSGNNYQQITSSTFDEMQLAGGKIYTDFGTVLDSESAALLGNLQQGTVTLAGPTFYDAPLSQIYVLTNNTGYTYSNYTQVDLFNPADFSNTGKTIPWNIPTSISSGSTTVYITPHRLVRWGTNGLLLHTKAALFTAQSNTVKDQSGVSADLAITLASSGGTTTGTTATYTATITNNGPQAATDVALSFQAPSTGVLTASTASAGACSSLNGCTLGTLASGSTATATIKVLQTTAGSGNLTVNVRASSTDAVSTNNTATAALTVTGTTYNLPPVLTAISPNSVKAGSADITLTVTGTNFAPGSTILLGQTSLPTTFVSSTQLTATVPAASIASMGWSSVTVSTSTPGGGTSSPAALTVFNVVTVGLNHIVYEPYSRQLYASVASGSSTITGSALTSIDPLTGTFGTPATFATPPNLLALSPSGNTLYAGLTPPTDSTTATAFSVARLDLRSNVSTSAQVPPQSGYYAGFPIVGLAVQPGNDNAVAVSITNNQPSIYDYSTGNNTFARRTSSGNVYYGTCIAFLDAINLLSTYSSTIDYAVTSSGLGAGKTLTGPSDCFQLSGNTAVTTAGKVFRITPGASTQLGTHLLPNSSYSYSANPSLAIDTPLHSVFYPGTTASPSSYGATDGILSYDLQTYLRTNALTLNMPTIEGSSYNSYSINDLIRWGKDGLALVTSSGHLYLLQGPFVVPQELNTNTAATLSSSSEATLTRGSGNTLLTLTGTNFIPGVAVTWNGSYRTTTTVDATHVTVAIPASDLASAGTGALVATNPGAAASGTLTIQVQ